MANNSTDSESNSLTGSGVKRPDSIQDALRVLDRALSGANAKLNDLVSNDLQHLKSTVGGMASQGATNAGDQLKHVSDLASGVTEETYERIHQLASQGIERSRQIYTDVDTRVRANPWPIIGGIAVGTFALGFLFGRSGNSTERITHV